MMPLLYAVKHVTRSWKLFFALFVGILLASAFFAGIDIKANVTARKALDQELSQIYADYEISQYDLNSTQLTALRDEVVEVNRVSNAEVIARSYVGSMTLAHENGTSEYVAATVSSIGTDSRVYDGWLNKPALGIGENETYVLEDSTLGSQVEVGDEIAVNFSIMGIYGEMVFVPLTLKVKGLAALSDTAYSIASGYGQWIGPIIGPQGYSGAASRSNLLLVSWEKTTARIHDSLSVSSRLSLQPTVLVYLNREALISAWDIQTSVNNIEAVKNDMQNRIATDLGLHPSFQDNIGQRLQVFLATSMIIRFDFTLVSLPIFFVAWYMGTTVSDVSFDLRRREIGLLSTKGFSGSQILGIFLTETLLIGFAGGLLGVLLGFLLNPLFTQFAADSAFNLQVISPYTVVFTVVFGVIIAFLSTFSSARRASRLPTIEALKEYMPSDPMKAYRKRLTWLALILGAYKIGVFATGINMTQVLSRIMFAGGNFIITLLVGIWTAIDFVLNYIGPLLFFWGFTKLFIQGSLEFQALTTRVAKFLGDLGALATKNVRRNPARIAAIAFLIALILGYSFQVTGQLASEHDFAVRQIYEQVGSGVSVNLAEVTNASQTLQTIIANISDSVVNATIETSFSGQASSSTYAAFRAVEPDSWLKSAYYEDSWFSGRDVTDAFNLLKTKNDTIILERTLAQKYSLNIGGFISMTFNWGIEATKRLEVVGFFGPEQSGDQFGGYNPTSYWSYVSKSVWDEVGVNVIPSLRILIKLKEEVNGTDIAETIRKMNDPDVSYVQSFSEQWEQSQSNAVNLGSLDVQRLGIVFAILAASVGTALVSIVSMKERSREAAMMTVKGLSYKQLLTMFLAENLAIVVFSLALGAIVGIITLNGNLAALDTMNVGLVHHRLIFPPDATLTVVSCVGLILASTILPILIMARNYVTNLERMVRLR